MQNEPQITCFLVKIASRCNLACDYCYMYRHADQSWQKQPFVMSRDHRQLLAFRIGEYIEAKHLKEVVVVFHGGEPLLAGVDTIVETVRWIQEKAPAWCKIGFSLQTNGVLLSQTILTELEQMKIGVSLSIDGPREAHDLHRLDHKGKSSFDSVEKSLQMLRDYPVIYSGLIAVIDPSIPPEDLFSFFSNYQPPQIDFLLPDANYHRLPPGRADNPDLYASWLIKAFDVWFHQYSQIPVRTFDAILSSLTGLPSNTDSFGFGDISLVTIETDGSYHDLDVLKITSDGVTSLGTTLEQSSIRDIVVSSNQIQRHRRLLTYEGLSSQCQNCSIVDICGGGSIPHRHAEDGFNHPTVYCHEMLALVNHARNELQHQLVLEVSNSSSASNGEIDFDITAFEQPETSEPIIEFLLKTWIDEAKKDFQAALKWSIEEDSNQLEVIEKIQFGIENSPQIAVYPSIVLWTSIVKRKMLGIKAYTIDGDLIVADSHYPKKILELLETLTGKDKQTYLIHRNDECLRAPFGTKVLFEDEHIASQGREIFQKSVELIESWRPTLIKEMQLISPEIQFIRDLTAHPDKIVSFSDNSVPGALYVSIKQGDHFVDVCDLADSLIHEHRHQKLYLLQRLVPLVSCDTPLVPSPWREDLRPPSGLLHAVFVFTHLLEFWLHLSKCGLVNQGKAERQVEIIQSRLLEGLGTLKNTSLTEVGSSLVDRLESILKNSVEIHV